jgi:molecular chaperone DnaK
MAYSVEKLIKEHGDKLKDADKQPLESAIAKAREAAKSDNVDAIKAATAELEQASHALSKVLYESQQAGAGTAGAGASADGGKKPGDDEVVDAEFEVKE